MILKVEDFEAKVLCAFSAWLMCSHLQALILWAYLPLTTLHF